MDAGAVTTNWNVSGGWNYTSGLAYGGARSLTESPGGNYTESDTRIAAMKNVFDLSDATVSYISFWTRHRAENFRDILRLQVSANSTDGFDGTWTSLVGRNTVQETNTTNQGRLGGLPALTGIKENWTRELIEIPASFYSSSNVRFRFEFSSDVNSGSNDFEDDLDDGFYIDDFKIIKSRSTLITLPVQFISFAGKLLPDETIRLDWEAITDQQHDYFEIQKSANGSTFTSMGKGPSAAPYWGVDTAPFTGNNFYRIKQVDKNGTTSYSTVINVYYGPGLFNVSVYPNPVTDVLMVKINSANTEQYEISITDMAGRKVFSEKVVSAGSGIQSTIDLSKQASQLFILTVKNSKNEIVTTQKLIKK